LSALTSAGRAMAKRVQNPSPTDCSRILPHYHAPGILIIVLWRDSNKVISILN
jgi:hypothetical protein